jgi:acyl-CoA synthetase (NDP forming)
LNEQRALDLFATLGIPTPQMVVLTKPEDATGLSLTYPVVAKILSADIAHKSDVGGVVVGIPDAAALSTAVSRLLSEVPKRAPGAKIDGVVVQEMARGLGEAIVGFRHDPLVGPVIVVGMGGILAEVYKDVSVRPAPVTPATAREMIAEVKGFAPLRGFRGLPEGDLDALAEIVANLSRLALATETPVADAEINPVIVRAKGSGAIAVDGLVAFAD